jgi:hypothetical protein
MRFNVGCGRRDLAAHGRHHPHAGVLRRAAAASDEAGEGLALRKREVRVAHLTART